MNNEERTVPTPSNFNVTENFGELIIEFPWNKVAGAIFLVFSFIWNGMLLFILSKMPPEFRFFIIIHAGVGLFLFYFGLCNLLNKTVITCDNENLKLKSGPLPAFNNKTISRGDI